MSNLDPVARPQTDAQLRRQENLEWCMSLLNGERNITDEYLSLTIEDLGPRFADTWATPHELMVHFDLIMRGNKKAPFPSDRLSIADNTILLRDAHDHNWTLIFEFDAAGNIKTFDVNVSLARGLVLRKVVGADLAVIEALDQAAPIPVDDGLCHIDHQGTLASVIDLLGQGRMHVVEKGGVIVGFGGTVRFTVTVDGQDYERHYSHHYRIHESIRGRGLLPVLAASNEACFAHEPLGQFAIAHSGNTRAAGNQPFLWEAKGARVVFDCRKIAGDPRGSMATLEDGTRICKMINHAHGAQEIFHPYTVDRLTERLSRAPEVYTLENFKVSEHATLGTWMSGETRRYEFEDRSWTEERGLVLDYGFDAGGLDDLEKLLRGTAGEALAQGLTHLTLFSCEQAEAWPLLSRLAERIEPYIVSCSVPELASAARRGVYIDPILA